MTSKHKHPPSQPPLQDTLVLPGFETRQTRKDRYIKDELNIAIFPLALPGKSRQNVNKLNIRVDEDTEWELVCDSELGGVPSLHELDYFYALLYLVHDRSNNNDPNVFFSVGQLIGTAEKMRSGPEYQRAVRALRKFKNLTIRSNAYRTIADGTIKILSQEISLFSYLNIVATSPGKRSPIEKSSEGYCQITLSEFFWKNLKSDELSKQLNYSFAMSLSSPFARRYFRMIDAWKHMEEGVVGPFKQIRKELREIGTLLVLSRIEPNYVRRFIEPVHKELVDLGYMSRVHYEEERKTPYVVYTFSELTVQQSHAYTELVKRGVFSNVARDLVKSYPPTKVIDAARLFDRLQIHSTKKKELRPAYLVTLVKDADHAWLVENLAAYVAREEEERTKDNDVSEQLLRMFYVQDMNSRVAREMDKLSDAEKNEMAERFGHSCPDFASPATLEASIDGFLRSHIRQHLKLPTFGEWKKQNLESLKRIS